VRKRLFIIIGILILAGAGYAYASYQGILPDQVPDLPKEKLEELVNKTPSFNSFQATTGDQLEVLSSRAKEVGNYAQDAFQLGIKEDTDQPVHEKAIEYGQYVYCKQVVETYENNQTN
jgi:hypothetical protein